MRIRFFFVPLALAAVLVFPRASHAATNKTLGSYDTAGDAQDVVVVGNYAYVADGSDGVIVLDVSNPAAPTLAGQYDTPGTAKSLEVSDQVLFVADDTSVQILSIATPTAPALLGSYSQAGLTVNDVTTDGTYAYVLGTLNSATTLEVVDISNAASPILKSSLGVNGGTSVVLAGDFVYTVGGKYLDIVNAYPALTLAGEYVGGTDNVFLSVTVIGSYAYVNDYTSALQVINVSTPSVPVLTTGQTVAGQDFGGGIVSSNGYAFVTTFLGLSIYDIVASPSAPVWVDTYAMNGIGKGVTVANTIAVAAEGTSGVQVLDVSQPDTVPPVVTPNGGGTTTVTPGAKFVDPGVTATDNISGNVSNQTTVSGTVNTNKVGKYVLTYTTTDRAGNTTVTKRTVIVAPSMSTLKLSSNTLKIKVGKKYVTLKPFPGYRGAVVARKAIVDTTTNPMYFFISTATRNPELVVYNVNGKQTFRQALKSISPNGLQVSLANNPATLSIYIAIAPSTTTAMKVTVYNLAKSGAKKLSTFTAAGGKGKLVMTFLKTYTDEYGLVTLVRGTTKKPYVWRYGGSKKGWYQDKTYNLTKLKWTKTSVSLKT